MGLVKFGQLTLNVEQIPDGHEVVSSADLANLRNAQNSYALLKSKIPVSVNENQLAELTDKGSRYDSIAQQLEAERTSATQLKAEVAKFSNIPKDYSKERWDTFVNQEQQQKIDASKNALTQKVYQNIESKLGVKVKIDDRFLPQDKVKGFDFTAQDAEAKWAVILDEAHTAQENFIKELSGNAPITQQQVGQIQTPIPAGVPKTGPADAVGETGARVQKF